MRSGVHARKGAVIRFWEGGGGGWRDPATRPPEWVLEDVIDGFVSIEAARDVYRVAVVVVDEDAAVYEVDGKGTARLRDGDSGSDAAPGRWPSDQARGSHHPGGQGHGSPGSEGSDRAVVTSVQTRT